MYDVATLQNMGLLDANFPYPLAFCTAFNLGIAIIKAIKTITVKIVIPRLKAVQKAKG